MAFRTARATYRDQQKEEDNKEKKRVEVVVTLHFPGLLEYVTVLEKSHQIHFSHGRFYWQRWSQRVCEREGEEGGAVNREMSLLSRPRCMCKGMCGKCHGSGHKSGFSSLLAVHRCTWCTSVFLIIKRGGIGEAEIGASEGLLNCSLLSKGVISLGV